MPPTVEVAPDTEEAVPDPSEAPADPEIPTDTMFDPSTPEGEVEQVVLADNEAYKACLSQLPNCDVAAAVRFGALDYAEGTAKFLAEYNTEGRVTENVESVIVMVEEVRFGESGVEAEVVFCVSDDTRFVVPGDTEERDVVIEEGFYSSRRQIRLVLFDQQEWLIVGSESQEFADGVENNLCAAD